eukprot:Sspe_Gene.95165::Locus_67476_Transcript_1_1_Confidence_1.000_Length_1492::g.95165::m.95165/K01974/RTCA, rtcA; RNA 3'-terminal phosphate cyclase (ATP)
MSWIVLDGDGGGGQVLRNGVTYAALMGRRLRVANIRKIRHPPGLRPQHLAGVRFGYEACPGSRIEGLELGSTEISFMPSDILTGGRHQIDPGTAGSCTLLLQSSLPLMLFGEGDMAENTLEVRGGTDLNFCPPLDYFTLVFLPELRRFGADVEIVQYQRGLYPKGRGMIRVRVRRLTEPLRPIRIVDPGEVTKVTCRVFATPDKPWARENGECALRTAVDLLRKELPGVSIIEQLDVSHAADSGVGVVVAASTSTGCLFGGNKVQDNSKRRPETPQELATSAVNSLLAGIDMGVCTDQFMQDQLILFMALADGISEVLTGEISDHTACAISTAEQLTGALFQTSHIATGKVILRCSGIGFTYKNHRRLWHDPAPFVRESDPHPPSPPASPVRTPAQEQGPSSPDEDPEDPDRRLDSDGLLYTKAQFVEHYGGTNEWDAAPRELRIDPADGCAYTKAQFVEFYGGTEQWKKAAPK